MRPHDTSATTGDGASTAPGIKRDSLPPILAARYELKRVIGVGGMGLVYEALDLSLHRLVALKVLKLAPTQPEERAEAVNRLMREARAMARVVHKNVVTVHDVDSHEDQVFVAMQLVEGTTMRHWLQSAKRTRHQILEVLYEAGSGLAAAHAVQLIHRDFKPDNILVSQRGNVRVTDFGLARRADGMIEATGVTPDRVSAPGATMDSENIDVTSVTRSGAIVGTPAYMAPEQAAGHPCDARADQFSFCVTAWESLYGARPFPGKNWSEIYTSVQTQAFALPPADRKVPRAVQKALRRGLSVDPHKRFQSMSELLDIVEHAMRAPIRRRKAAAVALAIAAVVVAVIVSRKVTGNDPKPVAKIDPSSNFVRERPPDDPTSTSRPPVMPVRERVQQATRLKGKAADEAAVPVVKPKKVEVKPPVIEPPPTPPAPPVPVVDPRLETLQTSYTALDGELRRRELLDSDVPAFAENKRAMKSALDAKDAERAQAELDRARLEVAAIKIDRAFVSAKMQRVGTLPKDRPAELVAALKELQALTESEQFVAANRKLNEIVKLTHK